jgi:hypothetical protein
VIQAAKEAAAIALMANSGANWRHADEQSIGIAIDANVGDFQDMAAGLALFPKPVAGAGKENHFAGTPRERKRFGIHESEHQHIAGGFILDDGGDQAA